MGRSGHVIVLTPVSSGTVALASSDTISISDSATLLSGANLSATDTVSISDTATLSAFLALSVIDSLSITDSADLLSGATLASTDTISISDSATLMVIVPAYNWYMYTSTPQVSIVTGSMSVADAEAFRIANGYQTKIPIGPLTAIYPCQPPQPVA